MRKIRLAQFTPPLGHLDPFKSHSIAALLGLRMGADPPPAMRTLLARSHVAALYVLLRVRCEGEERGCVAPNCRREEEDKELTRGPQVAVKEREGWRCTNYETLSRILDPQWIWS